MVALNCVSAETTFFKMKQIFSRRRNFFIKMSWPVCQSSSIGVAVLLLLLKLWAGPFAVGRSGPNITYPHNRAGLKSNNSDRHGATNHINLFGGLRNETKISLGNCNKRLPIVYVCLCQTHARVLTVSVF